MPHLLLNPAGCTLTTQLISSFIVVFVDSALVLPNPSAALLFTFLFAGGSEQMKKRDVTGPTCLISADLARHFEAALCAPGD